MSKWIRVAKRVVVEAREITAPEGEDFNTKWGAQHGNTGDFAIRNPDGEVYPCPRDMYVSTYEEV